ncbi:MerR family DNA-binding transcriptional regulator [Leucobacter sp. CSA1]|uniref:MerR family DNA-binding transcriptional regulator n=1 Tax=Leucobacter chromiisoli TaxID=2796471 RepID=A0A934UVJ7_9MICO|nr:MULTISPECIES: MerR family transcriptional regulator [Microbacteriaceae]MBK0419012.1 MerR family DNA-binding transcriptional regulator [Leucobacter chromiisoli]MCD1569882.1 MerR family DNA-binding transcriptional regulator [Agromyces mediolanus]
MRPVDLARAAQVTPQTVRNLEAQNVLPAAERTASGYRRYGPTHLSALHAYRTLTRVHGAPTARSIMVAITAGDIATGVAEVDAAHTALHAQREELDDLALALQMIGREQPRVQNATDRVSIGELAEMLGVRTSALRVWEAAGLLRAMRDGAHGYREYNEPQVQAARVVHLLRQGGYLFDRIRPAIAALNGAGSTEALTAAITERREALNRRSRHALHAAGLVHAYLEALEIAEA